jgi:hypothetical protein
MPALTRRRNPDARQESWLVFYGDVRVGTIAIRSGNPDACKKARFVSCFSAGLQYQLYHVRQRVRIRVVRPIRIYTNSVSESL